MIKNILTLAVSILFLCCSYKSDNPEIQKLYDEVMVIHDEVMPEMSTIHKLKKKIRNTKKEDSLAFTYIKLLEDADEAMMSWMADFKPDRSVESTKQIEYLNNEKDKISSVSKEMKSVIQKATEYVEQ